MTSTTLRATCQRRTTNDIIIYYYKLMQPVTLHLLLSSMFLSTSSWLAYHKYVRRQVEHDLALEQAAKEKETDEAVVDIE